MGRRASSDDAAWLDLAADVMASRRPGWPAEPVVRQLVTSLRGDAGVFHLPDRDGRITSIQWPATVFAGHHDEIARWSREEAPRAHPLLRYYLATGDASAVQVADVPATIADRRVVGRWRAWCRSFHDADVSSQFALPVARAGPLPVAFLVGRAEDFSEQEAARARRLHRVLAGLHRHVTAVSGWSERAGPIGDEAAEGIGLTPRELAVLDLLADGVTARVIARRIAVSERTVHKHLQRIYTKLGVGDRLTAVQRAQTLGVLAAPAYAVPDRAPRHIEAVH